MDVDFAVYFMFTSRLVKYFLSCQRTTYTSDSHERLQGYVPSRSGWASGQLSKLPAKAFRLYVDTNKANDFTAQATLVLPDPVQKLRPIHEPPCAAHSTHHSQVSHTQCLHSERAGLHHPHSASKCEPIVHIAAPGVLPGLSRQRLQAGDLSDIDHTAVEQHVSAHHIPAHKLLSG